MIALQGKSELIKNNICNVVKAQSQLSWVSEITRTNPDWCCSSLCQQDPD